MNIRKRLSRIARVARRIFGGYSTPVSKNRTEIRPALGSISEVLLSEKRSSTNALLVPFDAVTWDNGFSLHRHGWNPYKATASAIVAGSIHDYFSSPLKQYYERFRPANAAEYLCPTLPSDEHLSFCTPDSFITPWAVLSPTEARAKRQGQNRKEEAVWVREADAVSILRKYKLQDHEYSWTATDGVNKMGPVSDKKGVMEFDRIVRLVESMRVRGYRREEVKDVEVTALRHDGRTLFVIHGGHHRCAVLSALGHTHVPVALFPPVVIDLELLRDAPAVRNGYWSIESAELYLTFLFEEIGAGLASELGIL